jgi:hypothetical protein
MCCIFIVVLDVVIHTEFVMLNVILLSAKTSIKIFLLKRFLIKQCYFVSLTKERKDRSVGSILQKSNIVLRDQAFQIPDVSREQGQEQAQILLESLIYFFMNSRSL